ncbi:hypothetical protein [Nonlabens ponticola]|uniref:hypothetical protein n=1 Tax=Nonlabens ponticola TaxID=2496866 RepID=UPI001F498FEC|nr:hypothetical protein [Nonlabens ponticola]
MSDVSDDDSNLEDDTTTTPLPQDNSIAIIKEGTFNDAKRRWFCPGRRDDRLRLYGHQYRRHGAQQHHGERPITGGTQR